VNSDDWQKRFEDSVAREDAHIAASYEEEGARPVAIRLRAYMLESFILAGMLGLSIALTARGGWWLVAGSTLLLLWLMTIVSMVGTFLRHRK
jgi:hypothetical protein